MAKRKIVQYGDDTLRRVCRPVDKITPNILTLLDDMVETMRKAGGCGLAAVQVGVLRRVVVIEVEDGVVHEWINPEIIRKKGKQEEVEGCLSLPGESGVTRRPMTVTVRALNRNGEVVEVTGSGLFARAMCHELDHLDGKLYVDEMLYPIEAEDED